MTKGKDSDFLPLTPYRVLNLADERGSLCAWILTEFGADTIKIEPPSGDPARRAHPMFHDRPDESAFWLHYYENQRGITLDIETADGQKLFKELVKNSHFVVESFSPGYLDNLGLGYSDLKKINPSIVMSSITPFGQTGPHKDWKGPDIVIAAMGGQMYITGEPERPPLRVGVEQGYFVASSYAAAGTMLAHYHRILTGEGQHVDASAQEGILLSTELAYIWYDLEKFILPRVKGRRYWEGRVIETLWETKDGHVAWRLYTDRMGWRTEHVCDWLRELIEAGELDHLPELKELVDKPWSEIYRGDISLEDWNRYVSLFRKFFATRTKAEFEEMSLKKGFIGFRLSTPQDSIESPQIQSRNFFREVEYPEMGVTILEPGRLYKSDEMTWKTPHRAPLLGEHNAEIYLSELGLSKEEMIMLKQAKVI